MTTSREIMIENFCARHAAADAVQAVALRGDLVLDIAEFRSDWGPARPEGILEWARSAPGDRLALHALSKTGERCGPDECWETTASVLDPPLVA